MNVLWISYGVLGKANELFYGKKSQGGGWIEESANHLMPHLTDSTLTIISLGKTNREKKDPETGILYVEYGEVEKRRGVYHAGDTEKWKKIINKYKPDIIQVYGTEFTNGLNVLEAAGDLPVLFYIQGVMTSFKYYKYAGMSIKELVKVGGILSLLKGYKYHKDFQQYLSQIPYEAKMIERCDGVIVDGMWSRQYLQNYNRSVRIFIQYLPVSGYFLTNKWSIKQCNKNTLFTVAGRSPYKGIQNLIKALAIVKGIYPDIKLYIPGNMSYGTIWSKPPFIEYLEKLINQLKLGNNIEFCGQLTPNEMAEHMLSANLFVMPSCIENHSSSLREAMYLGVPCVSADVGCVSELARNGYNSLLFRYPEIEQLAGNIIDILSNDRLAERIGENAYKDIRIKYPQDEIGTQIIENYKECIMK